jgi:hypothetical protein
LKRKEAHLAMSRAAVLSDQSAARPALSRGEALYKPLDSRQVCMSLFFIEAYLAPGVFLLERVHKGDRGGFRQSHQWGNMCTQAGLRPGAYPALLAALPVSNPGATRAQVEGLIAALWRHTLLIGDL